ncbi:MAG: cyclodeaminase/cyclohydrolase family protein [Gemmatimonadetes bacterium]|nr:cyclodeaminase/cyclohydrolase family protein [Gemmatimonadota bacterium]
MEPAQTLDEFLATVADGTPSPGGGAAAAVTAALAAALAAMVGRLALARAEETRRAGLNQLVQDADALRHQLVELAARDAAAYAAVLEARRSHEGGEAARDARLMAAWREATRVPATVIRLTREVAMLARRAAREGPASAQGDALMAALLAAAVAAGSHINLRLNLQAAGRPEDLRVLADQSEILLRDTQRAAAEVRLLVEEKLTGSRTATP